MKQYLIFLLIISPIFCQSPQDDQVMASIPGYRHAIYSGYLDVSMFPVYSNIHYVYFQSQRDSTRDPVILWLQGGPGCSGLISMLQQNGPFIILPQTTQIKLNNQAWNKRAGLVYFQAPSGVGYSQNQSDEQRTDQSTALQLLNAITLFFVRHSNLMKNQLYIAGSGYGAIFATRLARLIINKNREQSIYNIQLKIKGILLGNPCINPDECYSSGSQRNSFYHYEFLYNRGFVSRPLYNDFVRNCIDQFQQVRCYLSRNQIDKFTKSTNISAFNIYRKCYNQSKTNTINLGCQDETGAISYLNTDSFKQAWHIKGTNKWQPCSNRIWQQYLSKNGSFYLIRDLVKDDMRIWVYSGDMDSTVPITGTKFWVNQYKTTYEVPIRKNWREWWIPGKHKGEDQVGGFIWEIEGLTVVTVKGAGFKAGIDQPVAMEEVLNGFLDGKTLPYKA